MRATVDHDPFAIGARQKRGRVPVPNALAGVVATSHRRLRQGRKRIARRHHAGHRGRTNTRTAVHRRVPGHVEIGGRRVRAAAHRQGRGARRIHRHAAVDLHRDAAAYAECAAHCRVERVKTGWENKLYDIGIKRNDLPKGKLNIAGYVRDEENGESLSGALIYVEHPHTQVNSDQFGYYSLELPAGRHTLNIIAPGMFDTKRQVMIYADGKLDIEM